MVFFFKNSPVIFFFRNSSIDNFKNSCTDFFKKRSNDFFCRLRNGFLQNSCMYFLRKSSREVNTSECFPPNSSTVSSRNLNKYSLGKSFMGSYKFTPVFFWKSSRDSLSNSSRNSSKMIFTDFSRNSSSEFQEQGNSSTNLCRDFFRNLS